MLLECKNLFKEYARGKMTVPVLKDINLSVEEGEYIAIMGPSGSGKTTLMNLIGCLDVPTSGSLVLNEEELGKMNSNRMADVRNQVLGFVFQQADLLPGLTARENVALPLLYRGLKKQERNQKAEEALIKVGLEDRIEFKPNQLSGGQCQRVAIARAIVGSPKLLLADEPTGALDSQSGLQVMELFRQLNNEGITIIMITHSQEVAEEADRIIYIRDGELSEEPVAVARPVYESDDKTYKEDDTTDSDAAYADDATDSDAAYADDATDSDATFAEDSFGAASADDRNQTEPAGVAEEEETPAPDSVLATAQKFAQDHFGGDGSVSLDEFDFVSLEDDSENDLIPSSSDADDTEGEVSILDTAQKFAQMMNPEYTSEQEDFDHE